MTIASHTGAVETRPCSTCGAPVEHRGSATASCGPAKTFWMAEKHDASCGLPCMGGGVHPRHVREGGSGAHGFHDRCPKCGPLRVLPEVVAEMRELPMSLVAAAQEVRRHWLKTGPCHCTTCLVHHEALAAAAPDLATNLLRALDEIDKLRAEEAQAGEDAHEYRERATFAGLELQEARDEIETLTAERDHLAAQIRELEHRSPPVEWAWLDERQRAEATAWIWERVANMRWRAVEHRDLDDIDEALRFEGLAASLLALIALPEAPSPLTPEQREMLGREVDSAHEQQSADDQWHEFCRTIGERLFLRGLGAGRDLLEAGQLLRRLLSCEELPRADREISLGLQIAVGRIIGAVERLGDIPPDREAPTRPEPATEQERVDASAAWVGETMGDVCGDLGQHEPTPDGTACERCGDRRRATEHERAEAGR